MTQPGDKTWFHVDMDAFYAAVEQHDNPEFRNKPVIVGARPGNRGVVAACSYEARAYGVHSAMPISKAYRLCPDGIYIKPRIERYSRISRIIMDIFTNFSPEVQQISIDEAFINMTGTEKLFGPPLEAGKKIKQAVLRQTGLTISTGIANSKFLAKLASDHDKPDGLYEIKPENALEFIDSSPLKKLWGIGSKTLTRLKEFGINTTRELRSVSIHDLESLFGKASSLYLYNAARAVDPGIYNSDAKSKSVSMERTFETDITDNDTIHSLLLDMSHSLMYRLLDNDYSSSTIQLKLRFSDFTTITVRRTLPAPVNSSCRLYECLSELLASRWDKREAIRLIGAGAMQIKKGTMPIQNELFETKKTKQRKFEQAIFNIKKRYSKNIISKARLLKAADKKEGRQ